MRAVEGGATIHTLGLEDLAIAHRYYAACTACSPPTWARRCSGRGRAGRLLGPAAGPRPPGGQRQRPDLRPGPRRALRRAPRHRGPPRRRAQAQVEPPVDSVVALNVLERVDDDVAALGPWPGPPSAAAVSCWSSPPTRPWPAPSTRPWATCAATPPTASATPSRPPAWSPRSSARSTSSAASPVDRRPGRAPGLPTPTLVRLYDRLVVPAERVLERRLQPRFGQSILCVAQVPEPEASPRRANAPPEESTRNARRP